MIGESNDLEPEPFVMKEETLGTFPGKNLAVPAKMQSSSDSETYVPLKGFPEQPAGGERSISMHSLTVSDKLVTEQDASSGSGLTVIHLVGGLLVFAILTYAVYRWVLWMLENPYSWLSRLVHDASRTKRAPKMPNVSSKGRRKSRRHSAEVVSLRRADSEMEGMPFAEKPEGSAVTITSEKIKKKDDRIEKEGFYVKADQAPHRSRHQWPYEEPQAETLEVREPTEEGGSGSSPRRRRRKVRRYRESPFMT